MHDEDRWQRWAEKDGDIKPRYTESKILNALNAAHSRGSCQQPQIDKLHPPQLLNGKHNLLANTLELLLLMPEQRHQTFPFNTKPS